MVSIGPRVWKTGLAVTLSVVLLRLIGHGSEVAGAVAAALAVAPSASRSLRTMANQTIANVIGSLIGFAAVLLFGPDALVIGGAVILVLWLCQRFGYRDLASAAVTVALFVMAPHPESSMTAYTFWRFISVLMGSVIGTAVNALILSPEYRVAALKAIANAGTALDAFIVSMSGRLERPHHIEKAEILAATARVEAQIAEARRLNLLAAESNNPRQARQQEVIDRAIKVLSSLLERVQIIHKAALYAQRSPEYAVQLPEIQAALTQVVLYRRRLFGMLLEPDAERTLGPALAELEQRFESSFRLPTCQEEIEPFFRLYRIRSSVSYMANRLGRLYVAKETALPPLQGDKACPALADEV
ncbi:MAG TPA: aromatic acid exporter family protein [Symbiobacteriaceae bacterium]|nr:aromatic acid exporter family protein [Symbiobacteriaceae bacterium]